MAKQNSNGRPSIAQMVRRARILKDIHQDELAKRINKKTNTVWSYERERIQIPSKVLEQIMQELDMEIVIKAA